MCVTRFFKSIATAAVIGLCGLTTTTADAATFNYRMLDHPDGGASKSSPFASYGLRLDEYGSYWSFENGGNVTMSIDDGDGVVGAGTMTISGMMRRSFGAIHTPSFGDLWDISYSITGLTVGANGTFVDTGGNGSGTISNSTLSYSLGSKANGAGQYFLFLADGHRVPGSSQLIGRGWVDGSDDWPGANDLLFTVTPVPLPAAAWLLIAGLGTLGYVGRRRKTA